MKKIAAITAIVLASATAAPAQSLLTTTTAATGSAAGIYPIVIAGAVLGTIVVLDSSASGTN